MLQMLSVWTMEFVGLQGCDVWKEIELTRLKLLDRHDRVSFCLSQADPMV